MSTRNSTVRPTRRVRQATPSPVPTDDPAVSPAVTVWPTCRPRVTLFRVVERDSGKIYWDHLQREHAESMAAGWMERRRQPDRVGDAALPAVIVQAVVLEIISIRDIG